MDVPEDLDVIASPEKFRAQVERLDETELLKEIRGLSHWVVTLNEVLPRIWRADKANDWLHLAQVCNEALRVASDEVQGRLFEAVAPLSSVVVWSPTEIGWTADKADAWRKAIDKAVSGKAESREATGETAESASKKATTKAASAKKATKKATTKAASVKKATRKATTKAASAKKATKKAGTDAASSSSTAARKWGTKATSGKAASKRTTASASTSARVIGKKDSTPAMPTPLKPVKPQPKTTWNKKKS